MKALKFLFLMAFIFFSTTVLSKTYYVSTTATSSGNGSITSPWQLQTALSHPSVVQPGDTIYLRGGTYRGYFKSYLNGTSTKPIIVRNYPGEYAAIDGGNSQQEDILRVLGNYTWYWGFDVFSSDPVRYTSETGSFPSWQSLGRGICVNSGNDASNPMKGNKFIHLTIHDGFNGFGAWVPSQVELYGCILYNNGWVAPDRPHGHNVYAQNALGSEMKFIGNFIWGAFENNVQAYGTRYTDDFYFEKNISYCGAGDGRDYLIGGGGVSHNLVMLDNYSYEVAGQNLNVGWYPYGGGMDNSKITGNYIIGGEIYFYNMASNTVITGNTFSSTYYQPSNIPTTYPNNTYITGIPNKVFVFPSKYEPGRGNIAIYNGSQASFVSVDLSSIVQVGSLYTIKDAQNFYGPDVLSGTYTGGTVSVPMAARTVVQPIGGDSRNGARISSFPKFGGLVVLSKRSDNVPIQLSSFTVAHQGTKSVLTWVTETETNNYGFVVQRQNGATYDSLALIYGAGTSLIKHTYTYTDNASLPTSTYRLKQINTDGTFAYYSPTSVTSVDVYNPLNTVVNGYVLEQNFPNPFNPTTTIRFSIGELTHVRLVVMTILGQEIQVLEDRYLMMGNYKVMFNGGKLSSGTYLYRLTTDKFTSTKTLTILK